MQRVLKVLYLFNKEGFLKVVIRKKLFCGVPRNAYKSRIKNFCVVSGRSRITYNKFRVSRILLRSLGSSGFMFGLKKAS